MSKVIRRRKNIQKNRFKTALIMLIVAVCLFVIYKFNFTTKSEIEVTTSVKFKEFEGENEILANIPVLEDENGKYIVLPEKVNGIFTSAYYLSDNEIKKVKKNTNTVNTIEDNIIEDNTIVSNTVENTVAQNTSSKEQNIVAENKISQNTVATNTTTNTAIDNSSNIENKVSNDTTNKPVEKENITNDKIEDSDITDSKTPQEEAVQQLALNNEEESLFTRATKNSEEYADMLEQIAETTSATPEETSINESSTTNQTTDEMVSPEVTPSQPETPQEQTVSQTPVQENPIPQNPSEEQAKTDAVQNQEVTDNDKISENGNEIVTEKEETLPGEKYYLSEEELENEDLALTVRFQTVEINGQKLYNQELTADMIDTLIKLTCYTPLGYYLDVKEEDVNKIEELKSGAEEIEKSETVFAYDIKITNGEKEFQPEEYYQVATVSITKPETVDFKSNSQALQLLHIKETEDTIDFQKVPMSKVENDSFEFLTNEFSIYAVILYAADQGDTITINDYESDKNYYLGKNYTDYMAGYDTGRYTEDNLAQVNINYYSYDPGINLNQPESIVLDNCNWNFNNSVSNDTTGGRNPVITSSKYTVTTRIENQENSYVDINGNWSMEFIVPNNLRETFINSFDQARTNSINSASNLTFVYDSNTGNLTISGQDMNMWKSSGKNHAVGPFELGFVLYFNGDVSIESFVPTSQEFTGNKRILVGTTSNTETHVLYSYIKCLPVKNNAVSVELIDNPFMDRPAGFGFNGWITKEANSDIITDNSTFVQTLKRTLTSEEIAAKQVTINVYVDWKEASIIFVDTSNGDNNNDGKTTTSSVEDWNGVGNRINAQTATGASNRELNIVVLMNGTLSNLSNDPNCAYTLTSLYNGVDYRNNAQLNASGTFNASNDIQIDFVKINCATRYGISEGVGFETTYWSGNSNNFRIGRGVYSRNTANATMSQVFGAAEGGNSDYKIVIESGFYNNVQVIRPRDGYNAENIRTSAILVLGSDIERVKENNNDLKVNYRVAATTTYANIYTNNNNKPASTIIVKSGTIGCDGFDEYYDDRDSDYAYAGIYVGGHGATSGSFYGDRSLVVEGGKIANIIGGLKLEDYLSSKTYIYVKDGIVKNIVGGAGVSQTCGDRIIQVTGGLVEYSVSGGSNGFMATNGNNTGELVGNTLVYVGGNSTIGSETAEYDNLYEVAPGTVCGAGNGRENYTVSGKVYTSHVIIDGNATINNSVYGGGNYGYVEKEDQSPTDIGRYIASFEEHSKSLVNGESYIIANGNSLSNYAIYNNGGRISINNISVSDQFYWTIEITSTNNNVISCYIKNGNHYLRANRTTLSLTTDKRNATEFSYDNMNRGISYKYNNRNYYLRVNEQTDWWGNVIGVNLGTTTSVNNLTEWFFLKELESDDPGVEPREFEVDTIDILGGTIEYSVYGGSNRNRIVGNVDINVLGGTVKKGAIYGGSNTSGNIEGNVDICIEGGKIGITQTQDAVFGGGYGPDTNINRNVNIRIKDTADNINILGNVYGGGSLGNIIGTTDINVEDHYSNEYAVSIIGNIFGGGKGILNGTSPTSRGNITVNVDGGTYENLDVYGGYNARGIVQNSKIAVNIGQNYETKINDVYGGGNQANVTNSTTSVIVKMYQNAIVNNAYNGGNSAGISGRNTREIYAIGANIGNIFGGSNNYGALEFSNVYVSDGAKIGNVFGGGNKAEISSTTNVDISDSEVLENVYGGGNQANVGTYTDVDISNSTINKVYGGGNAGAVAYMATGKPANENTTNVDIINGSNIKTVYGGGCSAAIGANSNIYIENSTITNVFGGGEGENAIVVGSTNINTNGIDTGKVSILENIYGGGDLGKVNENTVITTSKTEVTNNIFGGGNKADVGINTTVTLSQTTVGTVYGGGMNGAVGGATAVSILEQSTINNNVFGGGSKGDVTGNTIVNLDNSKVANNVFGGGEAARVNGTTVSLTNASEVRNVYGGGDNGITVANTSVALKSVKVLESAFGAGNGAPAIVKGKSYIYADGTTTIEKSLFAGGNNSPTGTTDTNPNKDLNNKPVEKATAVADIAGATIGENVYGGANTSVIYGDTVINIGNEAIKSYYTSIGASVPSYTKGKIYIGETIYGGGEQMDPNKEYNYDTVSVEGYIKINIDGAGYDTVDNSIHIAGSIFGSGHASRAGLPTSYMASGDLVDSEETAGYVTINGDVNIKNYGGVKSPKSMVSIQRCGTVIIDKSALWISGATDSTNAHSSTYFSFNHIDALKMKNDSTLYLRATSNLLKSFYSLVDVDGNEEKAKVEIVNEITGEDGKTYDAVGNYIYGLTGDIKYVVKSGQIFTADSEGNPLELVTDVKNSKTKSVNKNTDNRVYMYSGLNLNISTDENLGDDTWGPVEGMTFFGIFNTTNTTIDENEDIDISETTDTNNDFSTIHTGIYDVNYSVSDTTAVNWKDRDFNRSYVEGKHVKSPQEQDIQVDGFYTNYEKFGIPYGDDEEIDEGNYAAHNPTSYTDYITPTPDATNYYIWYAGPDQDFYYYNLALIASKLSTYGTVEKTLQGISVANATFKITGVDSSLTHGAVLYDKSEIKNINTEGNPNREFALAMKTGATGWSMNGETNFVTSPNVDFSGTETYKTENSNMTPSLGFYLYHSNNISDETELGFFTINMMLYYWKTPTQQARARVTIDVAINTKVYDDLGYDASITPGRQYELFPRTTTNITTKSSFSAYFQLYEKDFANNSNLQKFFSKPGTGADEGTDVVDTDAINRFINENYRMIKTDYVFPEDTTITMIDKSKENPTYYYYTVTASDVANKKKIFRLSEFRKMGSKSQDETTDTAEYYLDSYRSSYVTTVNEGGTNVTYQSESFIFIVDFESSKFVGIDSMYEIVKNQAFNLVLTSDVKNADGEALEISILEEYKERNSISFGIYNTDSTIEIDATISPNKIYLGDSTDISIETNYIVENKDPSDITKVYDTRYFDSKLGVKVTIYDEAGNIVHGANLLGAYFKITEADGNTSLYYPRTDGTTRMKIADKVSNSKATITFETAKSTLPTGKYTFKIESFGSADGVYFGVQSSDSTELTLSIINDEFGLESEIPENYVIIDKETGYTIEDTTGFTVEKEYEILDESGNVIGGTTEELNDGKNDFEYSVKYSSGYENPYIAVSLYRRNYDSVYDRTYSLVDLADYLKVDLASVPDNIKDQFAITTYDASGNENPDKQYVGYEAYGIDFINNAVQDALGSSADVERPIIKLTTKCSLKDNLISGTYKLVFTLYDKTEVEKLVETVNPDGTITAEMQTITEYQRIGDTFSYMIIK